MRSRLVMEYDLTLEEVHEAVAAYVRERHPEIPTKTKRRPMRLIWTPHGNKRRVSGATVAFELPEESEET